MLPRQPLRFLLADDPGAGKTIMTGLLMKELIARGDLERCLVVCPGSLAEQWQDELLSRFHLHFEILTNDKLESAASGNWFLETKLAIVRLDKLSRNEDLQKKLEVPDCAYDLIVCDEAHKMSAFFGVRSVYPAPPPGTAPVEAHAPHLRPLRITGRRGFSALRHFSTATGSKVTSDGIHTSDIRT